MHTQRLVPILNVSDLAASVAWFERLGWRRGFERGEPTIAWPPTDMPWGVREMHVRHPDGHILRIGTAL